MYFELFPKYVFSKYLWQGVKKLRHEVDIIKIYLLADGTPHQHDNTNSQNKLLPILHDCIVKLMSHFLHTASCSAIRDLFFLQIQTELVLIERHRTQAGDKLHLHPVGPNCIHKLFPMYHYTALQHVQKMVNQWDSLNELWLTCKHTRAILSCFKETTP